MHGPVLETNQQQVAPRCEETWFGSTDGICEWPYSKYNASRTPICTSRSILRVQPCQSPVGHFVHILMAPRKSPLRGNSALYLYRECIVKGVNYGTVTVYLRIGLKRYHSDRGSGKLCPYSTRTTRNSSPTCRLLHYWSSIDRDHKALAVLPETLLTSHYRTVLHALHYTVPRRSRLT